MFEFCPYCGQTIEQEQVEGRLLVCIHCKKDIGIVGELEADTAKTDIPANAVRCPECNQMVEVKSGRRTFVPHYRADGTRKICPGSGKEA